MFVGLLQLELSVFAAYSLKDKRQVVHSLLDKVRSRFNVSACQIDDHDLWNRATLAFAVVSNDRVAAERVLNHVRDVAEEDQSRCEVIECKTEWL